METTIRSIALSFLTFSILLFGCDSSGSSSNSNNGGDDEVKTEHKLTFDEVQFGIERNISFYLDTDTVRSITYRLSIVNKADSMLREGGYVRILGRLDVAVRGIQGVGEEGEVDFSKFDMPKDTARASVEYNTDEFLPETDELLRNQINCFSFEAIISNPNIDKDEEKYYNGTCD